MQIVLSLILIQSKPKLLTWQEQNINYISALSLPKLMLRSERFQIYYRYRIDKQIIRQIDKYRIDIRQIGRINIPIDILDRNIKQLEEEIEERVRIVYLSRKINFEL